MSKVHPAVLKQLRSGRRFGIFGMVVTGVYLGGTVIEYLGGWAEQPDTRALAGGAAFLALAALIYFGTSHALSRAEEPS